MNFGFLNASKRREARRKRRDQRRADGDQLDYWEKRRQKHLKTFRAEIGEPVADETADSKLFRYERDGKFDFELYRRIQNEGSAELIDYAWAPEENIRHLARELKRLRPDATFGLCHGAKHGREARWFMDEYGGSLRVLGTDIADSATTFENVVQWDFHEMNPEWRSKCDFIYSNSWDHAYDPVKAFAAWTESLKPGGLMLLDWSDSHGPDGATVVDPFGATIGGLAEVLVRAASGSLGVFRIIEDLPDTSGERKTLLAVRL